MAEDFGEIYSEIVRCVTNNDNNFFVMGGDLELEKSLSRVTSYLPPLHREEVPQTIDMIVGLLDKGFSGVEEAVKVRSLLKESSFHGSFSDSDLHEAVRLVYALNQERDWQDVRKGYMIGSIYDNLFLLIGLHFGGVRAV